MSEMRTILVVEFDSESEPEFYSTLRKVRAALIVAAANPDVWVNSVALTSTTGKANTAGEYEIVKKILYKSRRKMRRNRK